MNSSTNNTTTINNILLNNPEILESVHSVTAVRSTQIQKRAECDALILQESSENHPDFCATIWDGALCWPKVFRGTTLTQPCPDYVPGLHPNGTASKHCTLNGQWYFDDQQNNHWTNYTQCYQKRSTESEDIASSASTREMISFPNSSSAEHINELEKWIPIIKTISQVGYGLSFLTLILAFFILISIKKLRCPRNTLHSHLFVSFMLRAFMTLLKDILFQHGVGLSVSVLEIDDELSFIYNESNWACKLVTSFWQYFIIANYIWILMEGLYLHNLIFIAPFSASSSVLLYVLLGWGCPLVIVGSWIFTKFYFEDTLCWTTNSNEKIFLIIRIPIIISIVLNFGFFLNIIRVLFLKLYSSMSIETRTNRYRRWAKSTLVLMPLFGVHYMIFLWMSAYQNQDPIIEVVWLFFDQLFASFQGLLVAFLYCLLNGEVKVELSKKWSSIKSSNVIMVPLNQISSKFLHRSENNEDAVTYKNDPSSKRPESQQQLKNHSSSANKKSSVKSRSKYSRSSSKKSSLARKDNLNKNDGNHPYMEEEGAMGEENYHDGVHGLGMRRDNSNSNFNYSSDPQSETTTITSSIMGCLPNTNTSSYSTLPNAPNDAELVQLQLQDSNGQNHQCDPDEVVQTAEHETFINIIDESKKI